MTIPRRKTVDLSSYPHLVVIYLGMKAHSWRGMRTVIGFGREIATALDQRPAGLLRSENFLFSLRHAAFRQYWSDFESLERWARSFPHSEWWKRFMRDRGGTGFWHEIYERRGEIEAVYIDLEPLGLASFAPLREARGSLFSARRRLGRTDRGDSDSAVDEQEIYG